MFRITLDDILNKDIFTDSPVREHAQLVPMLSDLKVDTRYFNEKSWDNFVTLLKGLYPEDKEGNVFLVGGLISTWKFMFSKYEFKRLSQIKKEKMIDTPSENQILQRRSYLQDKLKEIPENVNIHIFYDASDVKNMIEMYSSFIDQITRNINTFINTLEGVETIVNRTSKYLYNYSLKYSKGLAKEEERFAKKKADLNSGKLKREITTLKRRIGGIKGSLKRINNQDKLKEKRRELSLLEQIVEEKQSQLGSLYQKIETSHESKIQDYQDKLKNKKEEQMIIWSERLSKYNAQLKSTIDDLLNLGIESTEEVANQFSEIYENILNLQDSYIEFNNNEIEEGEFIKFLESISSKIQEKVSEINHQHHIDNRYKTMIKRLIPEKTRGEVIQKVRDDYKKGLESLLSETNHKVIVHPLRRNFVELDYNGEKIVYDVSGFNKLNQNNSSIMRKEAYEELSRLQKYVSPEEFKRVLEEIDVDPNIIDKLVDSHEISTKKTPHFKVRSNDYVFRVMAVDLSETEIEPTILISLGPFYDVERARLLSDIEHLDTDETKKAKKDGASSGILLVDYTPTSQRFTIMPLDHIQIPDKTVKVLHTTDFHNGSGDNRWDLGTAIAWLALEDKTIEGFVDTGDTFQSFNYRGSYSEKINRIPQIQAQLIQYMSVINWVEDQIISRSNLKNPIIRIKGNHDKPLDEFGVVLAELLTFARNYPYIEDMLKSGKIENVFEIYSLWKQQQNGHSTPFDELPYLTGTVGHEAYLVNTLEDKLGNSYGRIVYAHKVTLGAPGDKMDPVSRTLKWIRNTGRFNNLENKDNPLRLIEQGHAHIWEVAMIYNGMYISAAPSLQSMRKDVKHPERTDSSFGLKVGFMKACPGAIKQYIPQEGPMTFEFLHEKLLKDVFDEKVKPHYEKARNKEPIEDWIKSS